VQLDVLEIALAAKGKFGRSSQRACLLSLYTLLSVCHFLHVRPGRNRGTSVSATRRRWVPDAQTCCSR
jgi:hypothetical protein